MKLMTDMNLKHLKRPIACFYIFFLAVCISGCGGIKYYVRPNTDFTNINRIAVLPFENFTSDNFADEKINSLVVIDLLSRGVDVVEPGEVMRLMRQQEIKSLKSISSDNIIQIGKTLNAQAVMTGSVGVFSISRGVSVSYPEVSMSLMLYEATTGDIIWSAWHTTGGASFWTRHFGSEGRTLDETAKILVMDTINTIF